MLKADGLNVIQTYSFWDLHEPRQGEWDWGEDNPRANVTAFLDMCAEMELFVVLRVGPFICGEWHYGGIPAWVNQLPGVAIRQSNGPWQQVVETYVTTFMEKVAPYLAKNGGPIIMLQIENEAGPPTSDYAKWNAALALKQDAQVPWLWCDGEASSVLNFPKSMPPLVPAFNGNDCAIDVEEADKTNAGYPLLWTENEGWYHPWGSNPIDGGVGTQSIKNTAPTYGIVENPNRPAEEMALVLARWVARGGAHMNYYMVSGLIVQYMVSGLIVQYMVSRLKHLSLHLPTGSIY
jgi:hypothetical protein